MSFDVEGTAAAAMARRLRSTRFAGAAATQMLTPSEAEAYEAGYRRYSIRDEPLSDDLLARADWEDENADRTITGEVPAGYDPRCFGEGEW